MFGEVSLFVLEGLLCVRCWGFPSFQQLGFPVFYVFLKYGTYLRVPWYEFSFGQ